jgi:hypothetical protein
VKSDQIGTFEEAVQFRLKMQLQSTPAQRLQDLEELWAFTTAVWEKKSGGVQKNSTTLEPPIRF